MSLIDTWLEASKASGFTTNTQIRKDLNLATGLNISNSRMYEWRKGVQRPPEKAIAYMMRMSLLYALRQVKPGLKMTAEDVIALVDMLTVPKARK